MTEAETEFVKSLKLFVALCQTKGIFCTGAGAVVKRAVLGNHRLHHWRDFDPAQTFAIAAAECGCGARVGIWQDEGRIGLTVGTELLEPCPIPRKSKGQRP